MKNEKRKILSYKNYFLDFYENQDIDVKIKILYVLKLISELQFIPGKYFQNIQAAKGIYEIRVEFEGNIFRIFSFFDKGNLVVLGNGFQKKTQKTPNNEIKKAEKIRKEYFDEKK